MGYNWGVNYFYRDPMTDRERGPVSLVAMARKALPGDTRVRAEDAREWVTLARAAAARHAPTGGVPASGRRAGQSTSESSMWLLAALLGGAGLVGYVFGVGDLRAASSVLLVLVLCGVGTLLMGSRSGMGYGVAFLLGLLLGPLGVLVGVVIWAVRSTRQTA